MRFGKVLVMVVLLAGLALTGLVGCGLFTPDSVEGDRAALVELYHATGGPEWTKSENWLSEEPLGEWDKVTTNSEGRVTELFLGYPGNNLAGYIPPELGNLSELKGLELAYNQLTGLIPPELGKLSNLEGLGLHENGLTGPIPPELGNLSSLEVLRLDGNQLTGPIPPELGNLSSLKGLNLAGNQLTGSIPPELANPPNLGGLTYEDNAGLCMPQSHPMQKWRKDGVISVEGPDCLR